MRARPLLRVVSMIRNDCSHLTLLCFVIQSHLHSISSRSARAERVSKSRAAISAPSPRGSPLPLSVPYSPFWGEASYSLHFFWCVSSFASLLLDLYRQSGAWDAAFTHARWPTRYEVTTL